MAGVVLHVELGGFALNWEAAAQKHDFRATGVCSDVIWHGNACNGARLGAVWGGCVNSKRAGGYSNHWANSSCVFSLTGDDASAT